MVNRLLLSFICTVFMCAFSLNASAQDNHFIYIQTENNQPFYIRLDGKVISSTTDGYLILSKMKSGEYPLIIGFPRNEAPEKVYVVNLGNNDEGFLLKKLDNQYSLFNLESLALIEGKSTQANIVTKSEGQEGPKEKKESNDAFTSLLARVVKDSSLLTENPGQELAQQKKEIVADSLKVNAVVDSLKSEQKGIATLKVIEDTSKSAVVQENNPPAIQEISKADALQVAKNNVPQKDTSVVARIDSAATPVNTAISEIITQENLTMPDTSATNKKPEFQVLNPASTQPAGVKRLMLMNEANGLDLVYLDRNLGDTIRMFMPVTHMKKDSGKPVAKIFYNPEKQDTSLTITPTIVQIPGQTPSQPVTQPDSVKKPTKVDAGVNQPAEQIPKEVSPVKTDKADSSLVVIKPKDTSTAAPQKSPATFTVIVNSDCRSVANEKEFNKLWKRMLTQVGDDNMIDEARKFFKKECFTVAQIRELSRVFLYDKGKYSFFDAAYPHAADSNMYYTLESELREPYYINRFKAMIQK